MRYVIKENSIQSQKIFMSNAMKQGMEILQMNLQELEKLIEMEVSENPVLEIEYPDHLDWHSYLQNLSGRVLAKQQEESDEQFNPSNFVEKPTTLFEHMQNELSYLTLNHKEKAVAMYILENINEQGYFVAKIENSAKRTNSSMEEFLRVLKLVQTIEPKGLAARNLRECLLLQIPKTKENELLIQIITKDLELLAKKKYSNLQKKYCITKKEVIRLEQAVKRLNPSPGNLFASNDTSYVIPDMTLEISKEGFEVLSNRCYPRLFVSSFYREMLSKTEDEDTKDFIKKRLNRAVDLIRNINRREQTMKKVVEAIVEFQSVFFQVESGELLPMKLSDISYVTKLHRSTISRAVRGKYLLTPRGMFELKYFFSTEIKKHDGGMVSDYAVKKQIQSIVKEENIMKPLSDRKISELLNSRGIRIARRTVAKYREALKIPCASIRKRDNMSQ